MQLPLGTRINHNGFLGTVRYIGPVDNTSGIWAGVEWDDPTRGKHDGIKDNKRYFHCRVPHAGSFIRPPANLAHSRSFVEALESKYIEQPRASEAPEIVVLGSSAGAIEVEAVRLDKVRQRLAKLERLREASLDCESVAKADPPGTILKTCPNICGLDLSMNLLPSWDEVGKIAQELPRLERLSLNRNRLQAPVDMILMKSAFANLVELQLNKTMIAWPEVDIILSVLPKLRLVEVGHNGLSQLFSSPAREKCSSTIEVINLDSNYFRNWSHICDSLARYQCLQNIILISNMIEDIPLPGDDHQILTELKQLALSANRLTSWRAIDAIAAWCPNLLTLSLNGNPLASIAENAGHYRPLAIARIPSLQVLDGAVISSRERTDSELFYLSYIVKENALNDEQRSLSHPQWSRLCQLHGRPDDRKDESRSETLSNQLIGITLVPQDRNDTHLTNTTITVLPSMTLRTLRHKLLKTLRQNLKRNAVLLWLKRFDHLIQLGEDNDQKSLEWLGIEAGSEVVFHVTSR
ncbi:hypothetical protein AX16_004735 [Volvariella volvacea WC 439]|nr:hypothetical protein AX16_004735 [Volvariella volvacea WC 439]